ncbi:hypothetical protein SteCoe_15174 [Stentor coeruleus]|uniref:FYVE-type domain-containing protein n=1 Tax=Stentor coeruleus TaxID=5963 RepID=A0A1R2C4C3_9CILI|nr:hypothetical protein SteCoe_15174 [Stentor coeruleus]
MSSFQDDEFFMDALSARGSVAIEPTEPDVKFPLAANRDLYLNDSSCFVCERNFTNVGIAISKKDHCRFCYRGACMQCLGFYYYHSENHRLEKMCSTCHNKLYTMNEHFTNEIRQLRLERIQLKQEIDLAFKQKERVTKERQIAEAELDDAKKHMILSVDEKEKIIKELKDKKLKLQSQEEEYNNLMENLISESSLLNAKYHDIKDHYDEVKKKEDKEENMINKLKEKYNQVLLKKIALANQKNSGNAIDDQALIRVDAMKEEIDAIERKITDVNKKNRKLERKLKKKEQEKDLNEEKINEMQEKLSEKRSVVVEDKMSHDEEMRLKELKKELNSAEESINTLKERLRISKKSTKSQAEAIPVNHYEANKLLMDVEDNKKGKGEDEKTECCKCVVV